MTGSNGEDFANGGTEVAQIDPVRAGLIYGRDGVTGANCSASLQCEENVGKWVEAAEKIKEHSKEPKRAPDDRDMGKRQFPTPQGILKDVLKDVVKGASIAGVCQSMNAAFCSYQGPAWSKRPQPWIPDPPPTLPGSN